MNRCELTAELQGMAARPSLALLWLMNSRISSVMERVGGGLSGLKSSSSSFSFQQKRKHDFTFFCKYSPVHEV